MVNLKRFKHIDYWRGETYKVYATFHAPHKKGKSFIIHQKNNRGIYIPYSMVDKESLGVLETAYQGEDITLRIARGICGDRGLCIVSQNPEKGTPIMPSIDEESFVIEEPEVPRTDPTRLKMHEVLAKMQELGALYGELKAGDYVIFSIKGNRLYMRPRGNAEADQFS